MSVDAGLAAVERGGGTLEAGPGLLSTPPSSSSSDTTVTADERHDRGAETSCVHSCVTTVRTDYCDVIQTRMKVTATMANMAAKAKHS